MVIFSAILSIKCINLEKENINLRSEHSNVIESLNIENAILKNNIDSLSQQLIIYECQIDSLYDVKQKVIIEYKPIVSKDLTESVIKLKGNLKCEKY